MRSAPAGSAACCSPPSSGCCGSRGSTWGCAGCWATSSTRRRKTSRRSRTSNVHCRLHGKAAETRPFFWFLSQPRDGGTYRQTVCRCHRSEEHTSELQSLMRHSYAVFCLKKKNHTQNTKHHLHTTLIPEKKNTT